MNDPEIGARVTLLPVNDLGVDAAILFSDILMVPYAMGMGFEFTDNGPVFSQPLMCSDNPLAQLHPDPSKLNFIYNIVDKVKAEKPANIPLIGFCGAPLTVLCYMIQGLGRKADFPDAIRFLYEHKQVARKLIDAVAELSVEYIKGQINHGVDVFQLFETHAGLIPIDLYNELFMPAVKKMAAVVKENHVPLIYFPRGFGMGIRNISPDVCDFLSVDWQTPLDVAREIVQPSIGLQGNLDPRLLYADKAEIEKQLQSYISFGQKHQNWIFNLGHGFLPDTSFENARFITDWVKNADWGREI